jgi:hypothetical protein
MLSCKSSLRSVVFCLISPLTLMLPPRVTWVSPLATTAWVSDGISACIANALAANPRRKSTLTAIAKNFFNVLPSFFMSYLSSHLKLLFLPAKDGLFLAACFLLTAKTSVLRLSPPSPVLGLPYEG